MKRWFMVFTLALSIFFLLSPCTPQAASPTASSTKIAAAKSSTVAQPQYGGIYKVIIKSRSNVFGYPPLMVGSARDYAPPFFDRLLNIGNDGKYKPVLALNWDVSKDGKTITFKLRQGVTFHDGTAFNAQAVKSNIDNLIPPKGTILSGITSVDVVDDYTVRLNLPSYNNLILFYFATNPATYIYSPDALKKNGPDWATTHPVGTGPFMLKDYQPNISITLVKNPNYWDKGLPYLNGIEVAMVPDPMTQMLVLRAGQANATYNPPPESASQLKDAGYSVQSALGGLMALTFDTKNSPILSKPKVREAIEYAIDKEAICSGPGLGLYKPVYQIVYSSSPDYNRACPPRKYNPAKAKKLLAEAGYPNGFSFKLFTHDGQWKDGWVAIQSYLEAVGIKMDLNMLNVAAYNLIRGSGKIEPGAAASASFVASSNTLFTLESLWRSNSNIFSYVVKPAGIDNLIDQAKLSRDSAVTSKINQQVIKKIYDDETIVPLWQMLMLAVVDQSVQDTGWFIYGDADNNQFGFRTWLKK